MESRFSRRPSKRVKKKVKRVVPKKPGVFGYDGKEIKPMSVVEACVEGTKEYPYPWAKGDTFLFLGEIHKAEGHCAIVNRKGQTFWFYHTDNFRMLTEEEL